MSFVGKSGEAASVERDSLSNDDHDDEAEDISVHNTSESDSSKSDETTSYSSSSKDSGFCHVRKCELAGVDVLSRIFPNERQGVLRLVLEGCGGDLLRAVEHFLSVSDNLRRDKNSTTVAALTPGDLSNIVSTIAPRPILGGNKSAFSPLPMTIPPPHTSHHLPAFPSRPSMIQEQLMHRGFTGQHTMLPLGHYPSVIPPIFLPPLSLPSRPYLESNLETREQALSDYSARFDLMSRPEMARFRSTEFRPDARLMSPSADDSA